MKFLTTYLQPGEEVRYRARIHIFLFLQPSILLGIGFMCYLDNVSITHYLGVTLLFLVLVSLVQRLFVKIGSHLCRYQQTGNHQNRGNQPPDG
jgi:hypothetical protein